MKAIIKILDQEIEVELKEGEEPEFKRVKMEVQGPGYKAKDPPMNGTDYELLPPGKWEILLIQSQMFFYTDHHVVEMKIELKEDGSGETLHFHQMHQCKGVREGPETWQTAVKQPVEGRIIMDVNGYCTGNQDFTWWAWVWLKKV